MNEAMRDGVPLIVGGRLPADPAGRRVGEPDLLVAAAGRGYRAADVKHHLCLDIDGIPAHCSSPGGLTWESADTAASARKRKDDLFQLAHYQRMLEVIGMAAPGARLGAIIGTEKLVTWFDLDVVELSHEPVIDVYGSEFAWRLAIIDIANEHNADPDVELAVEPVRSAECGQCPWRDWCRAILPFCDWRLLDPQSEAELFAEFWQWFSKLRRKVTGAGSVFRAYCYNEAHENSRMRRCAAVAGLLDEVEEFIASGQWVDLLKVFRAHLITGNPVKLKATAPLSGFSWEVEEPAGDESMVQHDNAVLGDVAARDWLLTYNRNDVEATLALRDWLQHSAGTFPSIENLEAA